jgi:hypothetical protein
MNLRSDLALMLSGHTAVPPCLLFRQADGLRLDGCVTLLVDEGQNLALSSLAEAALDHYADLLVHRLRRAVSCPVEVYFPASTAALVQRFEDLVARLTLKQAMALLPGAAPERIWLVHEAGALAPSELQLLMRLVGNFPGAGVRVVLLFGATAAGRKGFESPGRRFARWDIQPPSQEEATTMLAQARVAGGESVVFGLLGLLGRSPASAFTDMPGSATESPVSLPASQSLTTSPPPPTFQSWQLASDEALPAPVVEASVLPVPLPSAKPASRAMPAWLRWPTWLQVGSLGRPPIVRIQPVAPVNELTSPVRSEPSLQASSSSDLASLPVVQDVVAKPARFAVQLQRARVLASRLQPLTVRLLLLGKQASAQVSSQVRSLVRARLRRSAPLTASAPETLPAPVTTNTSLTTAAQELPPTSKGPRP